MHNRNIYSNGFLQLRHISGISRTLYFLSSQFEVLYSQYLKPFDIFLIFNTKGTPYQIYHHYIKLGMEMAGRAYAESQLYSGWEGILQIKSG